MNHFRVVRNKDKFYVEKRYRFLFWTYWQKLNAYGEPSYPWMEFESSDSAIDAMERCAEGDKAEGDKDNCFEVISEMDI